MWTEAFLDASDTSLAGFSMIGLSQTLWALAVLGTVPDASWLAHWCLEARMKVAEMTPVAIANTLWALSK